MPQVEKIQNISSISQFNLEIPN